MINKWIYERDALLEELEDFHKFVSLGNYGTLGVDKSAIVHLTELVVKVVELLEHDE